MSLQQSYTKRFAENFPADARLDEIKEEMRREALESESFRQRIDAALIKRGIDPNMMGLLPLEYIVAALLLKVK